MNSFFELHTTWARLFNDPEKEIFWKSVGRGENAFSPFPTMFSFQTKFQFLGYIYFVVF